VHKVIILITKLANVEDFPKDLLFFLEQCWRQKVDNKHYISSMCIITQTIKYLPQQTISQLSADHNCEHVSLTCSPRSKHMHSK